MSNEDIKMSDELKPCPFCNGNASMTQTGENFVIVRCLTLYCQPHPSAVCYKKSDGEYDFYPWNNRHDNPMALRIKELEGALEDIIKLDESRHCFEDGETQICNIAANALEKSK